MARGIGYLYLVYLSFDPLSLIKRRRQESLWDTFLFLLLLLLLFHFLLPFSKCSEVYEERRARIVEDRKIRSRKSASISLATLATCFSWILFETG